MELLLPAIVIPLLIMQLIAHASTARSLRKSLKRETDYQQMVEGLLATLNQTTRNLEKQNEAVAQLLAEKRAAWGLSDA